MTDIIPNINNPSRNETNVEVGQTFEGFLHYLKENKNFADNEISTLRKETVGHLEKCDFSEKGSVGLLIGKIQSGKTTSFTSMTALARDNDIPVVIVLGGISNVLVRQAADDLMQLKNVDGDISFKVQVASTANAGAGTHYVDPLSTNFKTRLQNSIDNWSGDEPEFQVSNVIITMKHKQNLLNLISALESIDFKNKKVLIIDDETDQHGLNGQIRKAKISSTNAAIKSLREVVDRTTNHVFLGYTATPFANLLQPLTEHLKPTFVGFISPGNNYIGGNEIFGGLSDEESPYVYKDVEVYNREELETYPDAPEDLLFALDIFIVGNLVRKIKSGRYPHFSMLVHPDKEIVSHTQCHKWISERLKNMKDIIIIGEDSSEEEIQIRDAYLDEFRKAYDNLSKTVKEMPDFSEVKKLIPFFLNKIVPIEINSEEGTGMPDWDDPQANIIIAGEAVNRGTVVQRLTVTYLCRKESKATDTTQQRGRFYGYKKGYMEYIRVFTTAENARFFRDYVLAEKTMWTNLEGHIKSNKDFNDLVFSPLLVKGFKPTRDNVHDKLILTKDKENWVIPNGPHFDSVRNFNAQLVKDWLENNEQNLKDWDQDQCKVYIKDQNNETVEAIKPEIPRDIPERNLQSHKTGLFDFDNVFDNLVKWFRSEPMYDKAKAMSIKQWLTNIESMKEIDDIDIQALRSKIRVFLIADGKARARSLSNVDIENSNEKLLSQVMSGRSPDASRFRRKWYPGDRAFFDPDFFTIQIHKFSIKETTIDNAWNIALHIPERIAKRYDTAIIDCIDTDRVEDTAEPDE